MKVRSLSNFAALGAEEDKGKSPLVALLLTLAALGLLVYSARKA